MSALLPRSLLTTVVVLIIEAFAATFPVVAGTGPAAFIDNLGRQLRVVSSCNSHEQKLAGFRELFREDFDIPGLGRFVLGRFWRVFAPLEQQEFLAV